MNDKIKITERELYLLKKVDEMLEQKKELPKRPTPRKLIQTKQELENNPTLQRVFKRLGL